MDSHVNYHILSQSSSQILFPQNEQNSSANTDVSGKGEHKRVGEQNEKASWDARKTEIFISLCVKEVNSGNRPGSHFNKNGWDNLVSKFALATNCKYTRKQLKNKWDTMKKEWSQWKTMLRGETGLGWIHEKGTVAASPDWWRRKIQANPEAAKFQERGPLLRDEQELLFSDVVANGTSSWTPSSGVLPPHMQDLQDEHSPIENIDDDISLSQFELPISPPTKASVGANPKRKSAEFLARIQQQKPKKTTAADKVSKSLDRLVDTMQHEAISSRTSGDNVQFSMRECLNILARIPEIEKGDALFLYATRLFLKSDLREMFICLDEDEVRLKWLQDTLNRDEQWKASSFGSMNASQ